MTKEEEIKELKDENKRLKTLLSISNSIKNDKLDIENIIDIEQLKVLFEKFSNLTGFTTGLVKQDTREVLISTGWTDICKTFHRGTKSSEYICLDSNKELTKNLKELQQISLKECQHGMVDGATPIIIDGVHLADLFSGQVLFNKPNLEDFKLGANEFGYDMDNYLKALEKVKITSKDKLTDVLEFLSYIAKLVAQLGKEKKEFIKLNNTLEYKILEKTKEKDILLSLFDKGDSVLFKWNNDEHWSIDYVSSSVEKLLGYTQSEFINNKITYDQCIHKKDLENVTKEVVEGSNSNEYFFKHEPYRIITKNGEFKWVMDYTVIIRDTNNKITHYLGYINDITQEKQKDKVLFEQLKLASMGEMIENIAHQWRQPLSIISTASSAMKLQKEYNMLTDKQFNDSCEAINNNVQYLSKTIDNFRDFIKKDKKKVLFNLDENINNFLTFIDSSKKRDNINILIDIDKNIFLDGYPNELIQSYMNLYNNSKDAFDKLNILDRVIIISATIQNNKVIIKFKDNAGGIKDNILEKIFEPYFTTKHKSQGVGLSLHITYNLIVDEMDGNIEIRNVNFKYKNKDFLGSEFLLSFDIY
ncbi:MAG: PocR ligand-binding domain-containing protein [Campylobacterota bacterium]|nr:PocR ligand-binding domain-containing protein [Campylobacterota bacterium]